MNAITERPLAGRTAIVTGASRGIGKAIAQRLASAGAHVVVGARSLDKPAGGFQGTIHETVEDIRAAGGQATPLALDTSDDASRQAFVKAALQATGGIDILVNNAGTALYKKTWEYELAEAAAQLETYVLGPWRMCNLLLPHMIERGHGWILNLGSSSAVRVPNPAADIPGKFGGEVLYASMKAAVHRFTLGLAAEVYPHNIAVNCLAPVAGVFTPGLDSLGLGLSAGDAIMEPVEGMAEAALDLVSHDPKSKTGVIAWSHKYLDEVGRPTMSLDGRTVVIAR